MAGPASSNAAHKGPTPDPGKFVAAGNSGEFRRVGSASGPQSSQGTYVATKDIGVTQASSGASSPADYYSTQAGKQ